MAQPHFPGAVLIGQADFRQRLVALTRCLVRPEQLVYVAPAGGKRIKSLRPLKPATDSSQRVTSRQRTAGTSTEPSGAPKF